ncbi:phage tail tip lysozyme [Blastococcus sp. SYSU D00669]
MTGSAPSMVRGSTPPSPAPPLCGAIARIASQEFQRWHPRGQRPLTETSASAAPILREYYRVGIGSTVTDGQLRDRGFQAMHPWSAVFVSYVMRRAGAGPDFPYSAAHQTYTRIARRNRLAGDRTKAFWGFRATEVAPRVGDLVCAARANSGATYDNIGDARPRATHCDVVTDVRRGQIRVVGGNVGQRVGEKWLNTRPDGRLDLTGPQSRFFAVIRCRGRQGSPGCQASPTGQPGLEDRIRRVMTLLTRTYGYPAAAAAGITGNLIAESGILPNRIEGSSTHQPMRAPDFSGRVRSFTPDEVRDRDRSRRRGPRQPGVGLAQWTSPTRRRGLFRHVFRGRRLGSAILSDLDAQVDYLVAELRRDFRQLDARLRSPRTTVDQASDAVLLQFERPAAVLGRSRNDPAALAVITRRRRLAAQALQIHRNSSAGPGASGIVREERES